MSKDQCVSSVGGSAGDTPQTPPLPPLFFTAGVSLIGREHLFGEGRGLGNQDSFGVRHTPLGSVIVSCDGCGSAPDSSTGSRAAVRIVLLVAEQMLMRGERLSPESFATELQEKLLERIERAALPLSNGKASVREILRQSYLFTLVIGVVTPEWSAVFGCGDGHYALNGKLEVLKPLDDNYPEYIAYLRFDPPPQEKQIVVSRIGLKVLARCDTLELRSMVVASDGFEPALAGAAPYLEGFTPAQLWSDRTLSEDPEALSGLLQRLTREETELVTEKRHNGVLVRQSIRINPFGDDVTVVVLTRNQSCLLPQEWLDFRAKHGLAVPGAVFQVPTPATSLTPIPQTPVAAPALKPTAAPVARQPSQKPAVVVVQPTDPFKRLTVQTTTKTDVSWFKRRFPWVAAMLSLFRRARDDSDTSRKP